MLLNRTVWRRLRHSLLARSLRLPRRPSRLRRARYQASVPAIVERLEDRTLLSAGALDPTFGDGGKVLTDIGLPTSDTGRDVVAYQSDGKSILVGHSQADMIAVRYNTDGTLDTTFGTNGIVRIDFGNTGDAGFSVAVDSQDRVLVGGESSQGGSTGNDFAVARLTSAGDLDTSFDGDGKQTIDFGNTSDSGQSVAVDSQDRVLVGGHFRQSGSAGLDFAVARLTSAGVLDTSFDGDGKQTIDFGSTFEIARSVAVDSVDRVLVGGYSFQGSPTGYDFAVARLTSVGALDTSFAGDGKLTIDFSNTGEFGGSVAVDSQDRVLVGGHSHQGATGLDFAVARLTSAGVLDTSFDGDGKQTIDFGNTTDSGGSVAVDSQGRVLVGGYSNQGGSTGFDFAVARLTSAGALDTSFDGDGQRTIDFGSTTDAGLSVAVDSQDRVLVGGYSFQGATSLDFGVARLNSSGTLDLTFGDGGKVLTDVGRPGSSDIGRDVVAYQSDGKSIVVGNSQADVIAVRYNTDGTQDTTFGTNGIVRINFGNSSDVGFSVAVDSQNRVLVGGYSLQGGSTGSDFAVARLTSAGDLDTSFAGDGQRTIDFGSTSDFGRSMAVDSQDRVLVGGYSFQGATRNDFAVARLTSAGDLDTSFAGDGQLTIDFGNSSDEGFSVAVDSQDRVLVGGRSFQGSPTGNDFAVARLTSAGALDTSFDGDGQRTIDFGNTDDFGSGVAVDSQDRVLVGGYSFQGGLTGHDFAVARLTSAGALDTSFDGDGQRTIDFGSTIDVSQSVTVDSQDRVLVGGQSFQDATRYDFAVARLLSNEPPTADAGGPYLANEGAALMLNASASYDPDEPATSLSYEWDLDYDGSTFTIDATGIAPNVIFPDNFAARTIAVRVTDSDGESDMATTTLTVSNVAPTITGISAPQTIDENNSVTVSGTFSDPALGVVTETFTGTALWSDGATTTVSILGNTFSTTRFFADDDPTATPSDSFDVSVTLSDDDLGSDSATANVTVNNVAPANVSFNNVTFGAPISSSAVGGVPGQTLVFSGAFNDVGTLDTHSATVNWGDGTGTASLSLSQGSGMGTISGTHVYATTGTFIVTVTVTDDDDGVATETFGVTITNAALLPDTCHKGKIALYVGGTIGADNIQITPVSNTGQIEVVMNGASQGAFAPTGRLVVFGQAGDDNVQIAGSITHSAWLYGGGGNDRLKGGAGHDVLLGEEGDDLMVGGSGRDLLVGGQGSDRIVGNADDDILIAGWLDFADRDQMLCDIVLEWTSDRDYHTRIENLNGTLVLGDTVKDTDADRDILTGSSGDDWFLFDSENDKATDLRDEVFANDLDWIMNEL